MKNIEKYQLKKCIFMELDKYKSLILDVTKGLKKVEYDFDYIYYEDTDKAEESGIYHNECIETTLSNYFGVTVTSIHMDDCDSVGIWICYKDEEDDEDEYNCWD